MNVKIGWFTFVADDSGLTIATVIQAKYYALNISTNADDVVKLELEDSSGVLASVTIDVPTYAPTK